MKAPPAATLVVIEAEAGFGTLEVLLDIPPLPLAFGFRFRKSRSRFLWWSRIALTETGKSSCL